MHYLFQLFYYDNYSLSILKRQLERGRDVSLFAKYHMFTRLFFHNSYIFARNIF